MDHFRELFSKLVSNITINSHDSEAEKSKKIIRYSFFGSLIILIVVSWGIFVFLTFPGEIVKVPMVIEDDIYLALKKLYQKRLVVNVTPRYSDTIDPGRVYKQTPKQGTIVKKGRVVSLYVSLGPLENALPDFRGFSLLELESYLNERYYSKDVPFIIDTPVYEFSDSVEKGRIIKHEPKDGEPIFNINKIKVWISNGPKDFNTKTISSYVGRNIDDVSKELAGLELSYTYEFIIVKDKKQDMIIAEQSIGEGKIIDDLIEEGKTLILKVNKYRYINGEKIKGTYLLDVPKKALPYLVEIKIKDAKSNEKVILERNTRGGVSIPIPYAGTKDTKLFVYFDKTLVNEIDLSSEEEL